MQPREAVREPKRTLGRRKISRQKRLRKTKLKEAEETVSGTWSWRKGGGEKLKAKKLRKNELGEAEETVCGTWLRRFLKRRFCWHRDRWLDRWTGPEIHSEPAETTGYLSGLKRLRKVEIVQSRLAFSVRWRRNSHCCEAIVPSVRRKNETHIDDEEVREIKFYGWTILPCPNMNFDGMQISSRWAGCLSAPKKIAQSISQLSLFEAY